MSTHSRLVVKLFIIALSLSSCAEYSVTSTVTLVPNYAVSGYITVATGESIDLRVTRKTYRILVESDSSLDTQSVKLDSSRHEPVLMGGTDGIQCSMFVNAVFGFTYLYEYNPLLLTANSHQILISGKPFIDNEWMLGVSHTDSVSFPWSPTKFIVGTTEIEARNIPLESRAGRKYVDVYRRSHISSRDESVRRTIYIEPGNMVVRVDEKSEPRDYGAYSGKMVNVIETRFDLDIKRISVK